MARKSKGEKGRIAAVIRSERMHQPGYAEILEEHERLERLVSGISREKEIEKNQQIQGLLTGSRLGAICYRVNNVLDDVGDVLRSGFEAFPRLSFGLLLILLFIASAYFGWFWTICLIVLIVWIRWLPTSILNRRRRLFEKEINELEIEYRQGLQEMRQFVSDQYEKNCDQFIGYPPDWQGRRQRVLRRDDCTCQSCFKRYSSNKLHKLHVHHILEISKGGDNRLENLTTLCASCHGKEHARNEWE